MSFHPHHPGGDIARMYASQVGWSRWTLRLASMLPYMHRRLSVEVGISDQKLVTPRALIRLGFIFRYIATRGDCVVAEDNNS